MEPMGTVLTGSKRQRGVNENRPHWLEGFNDIRKSITAWSDKFNIGTWRPDTWTDNVPDSFNIYVDYNNKKKRYEYFFH